MEEKKVEEMVEKIEEETLEEQQLPVAVEKPAKGFKLWKTKDEKLEENKLASQRKIAEESLKLAIMNDPDDQAAAAELKKMQTEDFLNGLKKVGKAVVKITTGVVIVGGTVAGAKAVIGKKSSDAIDTTFDEVSTTETPEE